MHAPAEEPRTFRRACALDGPAWLAARWALDVKMRALPEAEERPPVHGAMLGEPSQVVKNGAQIKCMI